MVNIQAYHQLLEEISPRKVKLVAVSKFKTVEHIQKLYDAGQKDFGENYVQELVDKQTKLPQDIQWHFIGHLQSNKVKYIAPFVYLIHGVDSVKLLKEIQKQAAKNNRVIPVLLQVYIAMEESKFGFDDQELAACLDELMTNPLPNIQVVGLMGMASFSEDQNQVKGEMQHLKKLYDYHYAKLGVLEGLDKPILSMGMSGDYPLAIDEGSNMIRVGSLLFGAR